MENIKKYLNWEIILTLLVNFFLADFTLLGMFILLYAVSIAEPQPDRAFSIMLFVLFLAFLRIIYLPILYTVLEKKSKNEIVQRFISCMKNSKKTRVIILLVTLLPVFLYVTYSVFAASSADTETFLFVLHYAGYLLLYTLGFGLFGSYIVLFLWWYLKDKFKQKQ